MKTTRNPDAHHRMIDDVCLSLKSALDGFGWFQRRFFPPAVCELRRDLVPYTDALKLAREKAGEISLPGKFSTVSTTISDAIDLTLQTLKTITDAPESDFQQTVVQVMRSRRKICQVQEKLYDIRWASPVLNRFFLEPGVGGQAEKFDSPPDSELRII